MLELSHTAEYRSNSNIMKPARYHARMLVALLKKQKIATMDELKAALGTDVGLTVFRKLKELSYYTSYSHRGAYYTLDQIARFGDRGLWCCRSIWFSRFGTLVATVEAFVNEAETGCFAAELEEILSVGVKQALRKLVQQRRMSRQKLDGVYLYCCMDKARKKQQLLSRKVLETDRGSRGGFVGAERLSDEVRAGIVLLSSLMNEKQRRLYAGLESVKLGRGGDRRMAELLGLDVSTVARGRHELLQRDVEIERVRRPSGGRKQAENKRRK